MGFLSRFKMDTGVAYESTLFRIFPGEVTQLVLVSLF